jgi:Secretion system C-terminal sorting domain
VFCLWGHNLIHSDSLQNIVIDQAISGNDQALSSYFRTAGLNVYDIQNSNSRFFVMAGSSILSGNLYYSDDTCHTWHQLMRITNIQPEYTKMKAVNGYVYVATRDTIYGSADNGNTWNGSAVNLLAYPATNMDAHDSTVAIINFNGYIYYSTNMCHSVIQYSHQFSSGLTGVAVSDSGIYVSYSTKAGLGLLHPSSQRFDTINVSALPDSSIVFVYTDSGRLLISTTNSGIFWMNEATKAIHHFGTQIPAVYSNVNGIDVDSSRIFVLSDSKWLYYSNNTGRTFNQDYYTNGGINTVMIADTTPYFYQWNAPVNFTSYQLVRISGSQAVIVSQDSDLNGYGPQALFSIGDSSFYRLDLTSVPGRYHVLHSADAGRTWALRDSMFNLGENFDYKVVGDTAYVLCGVTLYVYDKRGNRAYEIPSPAGLNYYFPSRVWVTDSLFILSGTQAIYALPRGGGSATTIAAATDFGGTTITTTGWKNGYLLVSVDSQGVFLLPPDSSHWRPFNDGLTDLTVTQFFFSDSFVYAHLSGNLWLWQRPLSDLSLLPATCADTTILLSHAICHGDTFTFAGHKLTTAGTFSDTLMRAGGCDSIVTLHLTVNSLPNVSLSWQKLVMDNDLFVRISVRDTFFDRICYAFPVFAMTGGMPAGGTYTGSAIVNDTFNMGLFTGIGRDTVTYTYTDSNGCSSVAVDYFNVEFCEGIKSIPGTNSISLYPNPNNGSFTLQTYLLEGQRYTITDILGKIVAEGLVERATQPIDLPKVNEGSYTLSIGGAQPLRFVVLR